MIVDGGRLRGALALLAVKCVSLAPDTGLSSNSESELCAPDPTVAPTLARLSLSDVLPRRVVIELLWILWNYDFKVHLK